MTRIRWVMLLSVGLLCAGVSAHAQQAPNISADRHPNLAAAQAAVRQAHDMTTRAQIANQSQLDGHGERAKQLLRAADRELAAAALNAEGR